MRKPCSSKLSLASIFETHPLPRSCAAVQPAVRSPQQQLHRQLCTHAMGFFIAPTCNLTHCYLVWSPCSAKNYRRKLKSTFVSPNGMFLRNIAETRNECSEIYMATASKRDTLVSSSRPTDRSHCAKTLEVHSSNSANSGKIRVRSKNSGKI